MIFRTARLGAVVMLGVMVMAACSQPALPPTLPPVVFGSAPPSGPKLGREPRPDSDLPPGQWPNACRLITDDEIVAILPEARSITTSERQAMPQFLANYREPNKAPSTKDVMVGSCEYTFWLPDRRYDGERGQTDSYFQVDLVSIADPALVQHRYAADKEQHRNMKGPNGSDPSFRDLADTWGTHGCFLWSRVGRASCYQGAYRFEVSSLIPPLSLAAGIEHYGKNAEPHQIWQDKVVVPVVRMLAARMS